MNPVRNSIMNKRTILVIKQKSADASVFLSKELTLPNF
jgi:hypothetical protein